jgi:hypothetical protein
MKKIFTTEKFNLTVIKIIFVLALIVVITPILMLAKYDYPSADDWSYGVYGYQALKNGGNVLTVLKMSFKMAYDSYFSWEGRFVNSFLASLQPGIFGEKYYAIVPWMMVGMIIVSQIFLIFSIIDLDSRENCRYCIPIIVPMLIMEILYTPSTIQSFYWYCGAVNYTFIHGISFILLGLFLKLALKEYGRAKYSVMAVIASLAAVLTGGDNFATSLYTVLTLWVLLFIFFFVNKKAVKRTWFIALIATISLLICIAAPGNSQRLNANFNGQTKDAVQAVIMSFVQTFKNICLWTNIKVILMIFLILPFAWKLVNCMKYRFRMPAIFTVLSFGIYSSQLTATLYVDGTTGGGRMEAIVFYSYMVWLVMNVIYWIGWLNRFAACKLKRPLESKNILNDLCGKYILVYCAIMGIILAAVIYKSDLKEISSYKAYRDYKQGWAQVYALEWEERLEILRDDNIKNVEFEHLSVYPEAFMYTDLQDEYGFIWVNYDCARYYGKESITVKPFE